MSHNEEGETLNTPQETYEFKNINPFIIFVNPVMINFQVGKMCYDIRLLLPLCILLLS